jgi:hypothetical protein
VSATVLEARRTFSQVEEIRLDAGRVGRRWPLRKVDACAVIRNPFAGHGHLADLSELVDASGEFGTLLGVEAARLLDAPVESDGKGARPVRTASRSTYGRTCCCAGWRYCSSASPNAAPP